MSFEVWLFQDAGEGSTDVVVSRLSGAGCPWRWPCGRWLGEPSFFSVAMLARLSKVVNIDPKSPPMSNLLPSSSLGGVAVLVVEAVRARVRPYSSSRWKDGMGGISGRSSCLGAGTVFFFCPPKEKVRPARSRKLDVLDLVSGRGGVSLATLRFPPRSS